MFVVVHYAFAMVTTKSTSGQRSSVALVLGVALSLAVLGVVESTASAAAKSTKTTPPPALDKECARSQVGKTAVVNGQKLQCAKKPWVVPQWKPVAGPAGKPPKGTTFPDAYVGTMTMSSRPGAPFTFNATGTMRLQLNQRTVTQKFADYRLTEFTYTYNLNGADAQGQPKTCSGTLAHESVGDGNALYVVLRSTQMTPPNYYSLAIRGNVRVCDGEILSRLAWPDDLDVEITDRTYTYTADLVGSVSSKSSGLPWTWNLKPQ
jgi:hypothetical protein